MIPAALVTAMVPTAIAIVRKADLAELATDAADAMRPLLAAPADRERVARLLVAIAARLEAPAPLARAGQA